MNKEKILTKISILEKKANLRLSKEEKERFIVDYLDFLKSLDEFEKIKLNNTEPVDFPFEIFSSHLREDEIIKSENINDLLKNSKNTHNNYFILEKKNEK